MVARGDPGVEIGDPELVGIQKALIRRARQLNRSVITATQMMESMITQPDADSRGSDGRGQRRAGWYRCGDALRGDRCRSVSFGNRGRDGARVSGRGKIPSLNVSKHRLDVQFDNVEEAIAMSAMYAANHLKGITAIITA